MGPTPDDAPSVHLKRSTVAPLSPYVRGPVATFRETLESGITRWSTQWDITSQTICRHPSLPDVCLSLIQGGYAWHYTAYASEQTSEQQTSYAQAQREAQDAGRGLWVDPAPMPPWEWRIAKEAAQQAGTVSADPSAPVSN
jgi:Staphylococcal nuclease homologue